jgi:hypothetical protein
MVQSGIVARGSRGARCRGWEFGRGQKWRQSCAGIFFYDLRNAGHRANNQASATDSHNGIPPSNYDAETTDCDVAGAVNAECELLRRCFVR